jgi:chitinase
MIAKNTISKLIVTLSVIGLSSCFFDSEIENEAVSSSSTLSSSFHVNDSNNLSEAMISSEIMNSSSSQDNISYKVIAFQPFYAKIASAEQMDKLTHLIYFSVLPNYDGGVDDAEVVKEDLKYLTDEMHKRNKKILISVGGWGRSTGFEWLLKDPITYKKLTNDLIAYVIDNDLDGLDLDWEYPANEEEKELYGKWLSEMADLLHSAGKVITVNVHRVSSHFGSLDKSKLDWIHIMSYDQSKGVNNGYTSIGKSGNYEESLEHLSFWESEGFDRSQIVLGVPFYGVTLKDGKSNVNTMTYDKLKIENIDLDSAVAIDDSKNPGLSYFYNGVTTMKKKRSYVQGNGFGGIMLWEISQDRTDSLSLLNAIGVDF